MSNRFNGGRGAITCDNPAHDGRMICEFVVVSDEPPYLPIRQPAMVHYPDAVWRMGSDGCALHYCSAACGSVGPNPDAKPLFPTDLPAATKEIPRVYVGGRGLGREGQDHGSEGIGRDEEARACQTRQSHQAQYGLTLRGVDADRGGLLQVQEHRPHEPGSRGRQADIHDVRWGLPVRTDGRRDRGWAAR
jgi:hypothetical protein